MSEFINTIDVLGDDAVIDSIINRTITEFNDNTLETVGDSAFRGCTALTSVDLPNCKTVHGNAFNGCSALTSFNFESVTSVSAGAFGGALTGAEVYIPNEFTFIQYNAFQGARFTKVYAPKLKSVPLNGFGQCGNLVKAELPSCTSLDNNAFGASYKLEYLDILGGSIFGNFFGVMSNFRTFIIRQTSGPASLSSSAYILDRTPFANGEGYIYVPRALIDDYKAATNWSNIASRYDCFRALEDYTVDGTTTGKFDETKI